MFYFLSSIVLILVDFFSKRAAIQYLKNSSIEIISGILRFTYVENTGAAFGIMKDMRWFFILLTVVLLAILFYLFKKSYVKNLFMRTGLLLIISGAIGNLIDRILFGYVVDFIDFYIIDFPVFNVADCLICVGAAMLLIYYIFIEKDIKNEQG